ncbi:MAG TPA: zinc-dependent alcohol dehydrogenase family protein [Steroidobacteraceae bacterium]|nr:zinc-dependent alcohol dehydrogenase family protein [Steroidobacteraceae bacterium]
MTTMKIKAAVLRELGTPGPYAESRPLAIEEFDLAPPGPGEVLVRVRAAGLCHSDLSVIDGNRPRPMPMVLGHEMAGVVEAVGHGVADLQRGDHVVASFVPSCGVCSPCVAGRPALCEPGLASNTAGTLLSGARRLGQLGHPVNHHLGVSGFAEYATVSRRSLVRVDPTLPFAEAALFGCAVITGVGAVVNTASMPKLSSMAVIGLGGVGLASLLAGHMLEAAPIVAIDLNESKLAKARELGATHTVNAADPDCVEHVRELSGGGVGYAFEMAGSARALELAYRITRRGGTTVTAGLPHPQHTVTIPHVTLVAEERTLKGSYLGSCVPERDIPQYIEWYRAGRLPVDRLLSERIRLDDINAAFDRLAAGASIRQVIEIG